MKLNVKTSTKKKKKKEKKRKKKERKKKYKETKRSERCGQKICPQDRVWRITNN